MSASSVPHFAVFLTKSTVDEHVKMFLRTVFNATEASLRDLKKLDLDGGLTNVLVGYDISNLHEQLDDQDHLRSQNIFLVKLYGHGTENYIDRSQEIANFHELSRSCVAPTMYCTFSNGFCYKYIKGNQCTVEDFKNWNIVQLSARSLARFHSVVLSDEYVSRYTMEPVLFPTIYAYMNLLNEHRADSSELRVPSIQSIRAEVDLLKDVISNIQDSHDIVFCHNDLNLPNLIYDPDSGIVHSIDYEYAAPNYAAYDIANHFQEFAGNSEVPDFELVPDKETQCRWLHVYLCTRAQLCSDTLVTDDEVNKLYAQVAYFSLLSHLMWGIWSIVQEGLSHIDHDYIGYAGQRFQQYFACKTSVFDELLLQQ